jgi:hypothetical protein
MRRAERLGRELTQNGQRREWKVEIGRQVGAHDLKIPWIPVMNEV